MKKVAKNPAIDPTLPKVPLVLGDETFYLCFTFGALALAEAKLRAMKIECNLLHALDLSSLDASRMIPLLYAAMITHSPEIEYAKVVSLVTFKSLADVFESLGDAYVKSLADPDKPGKEDPDKPLA